MAVSHGLSVRGRRQRLLQIAIGAGTAVVTMSGGTWPGYALADPPPPIDPALVNLPEPLSVVSSMSQIFEFDSNPLLLSTDRRAVFGSITEPQVTLTAVTPTIRLDWNTRLDINEYDQANFSSVDLHSHATASQTWQTGYVKLGAALDYDTTRTSELTTSGINVAGVRHTGILVQPELGIDLTPADTAVLSGMYQQANYAASTIFSDYRFVSFNPQLVHAVSLRDSGLILLQASHYETISNTPATEDAVGAGLGWQHHFNARLGASMSGGGQWSRISSGFGGFATGSVAQSSIGFFYNLSLSYAGTLDTISIGSSRGISPEGIAATALQTALTASESHRFTPRLALNVRASFANNEYATSSTLFAGGLIGRTKNYLEINASVSYNLTRNLSLQPTYRFRTRDVVGLSGASDSHSFLINFVFMPHAAVIGW